jgi:hypothetical protein
MKRGLGSVVVVIVIVTAAVWPTPAWAASYSAPLRTAVASMTVATENRTGYNRSLFPLWTDTDGDGCNTRYEILITEATVAPSVGRGCTLKGGRWYSYYENAYHTLVSDLDIDHLVPLAEAWDSGARSWTTARRRAYANDLGDPRPLAAVKDTVNQGKGDQDPARWLPPYGAARCRYVQEWVATKIRWKLTVDSAEKKALTGLAASCPNAAMTVAYA